MKRAEIEQRESAFEEQTQLDLERQLASKGDKRRRSWLSQPDEENQSDEFTRQRDAAQHRLEGQFNHNLSLFVVVSLCPVVESLLSLREELDRRLGAVDPTHVSGHRTVDSSHGPARSLLERGRASLDQKETELLTDVRNMRRRIVESRAGRPNVTAIS